ncbi:MAG: hypothetical protein PHT23_08610, partial [Bacteroidales bacterium]|nr:hypothetical protein [Bacteroidales bacterium]
MRRFVFFKYLIFALTGALFVISSGFTYGQEKPSVHELTIYVVPSHSPLNWESPSSIYTSSFISFIKA